MHKVKLGRGVWYTKLRTKNAFGASKMSADHEVTVVSSESVQKAGILSFGNYFFIIFQSILNGFYFQFGISLLINNIFMNCSFFSLF